MIRPLASLPSYYLIRTGLFLKNSDCTVLELSTSKPTPTLTSVNDVMSSHVPASLHFNCHHLFILNVGGNSEEKIDGEKSDQSWPFVRCQTTGDLRFWSCTVGEMKRGTDGPWHFPDVSNLSWPTVCCTLEMVHAAMSATLSGISGSLFKFLMITNCLVRLAFQLSDGDSSPYLYSPELTDWLQNVDLLLQFYLSCS